jgi:hypothetical protein
MTQDPSIPYEQAETTWLPPAAAAPPIVEPLPERKAARAVAASVAAGFLAQLLFVGQLPGINFPIWIAVVLAAASLLRRRGARIDRYDLWLPPAALAFATLISLRADPSLLLFDVLACLSLTLAAAVAIGGQPVSRTTWARIVELGSAAIGVAWVGAAPIARGLRPLLAAFPTSRGRAGGPIVRGLLIAIPLVVGFVVLFAAADAVFQSYVDQLVTIRLDGAELTSRLIFALLACWLFAGVIAVAWLSRDRFPARYAQPGNDEANGVARRGLASTEAVVVLIALDLVFAIFVAIQAAYLYPAADPLGVSGMTYAEYARRGFFELVLAAFLVGVVIVGLDSLIERRTPAFRIAALVLTILTGVVLASATVRMGLYQQAYGWTELRFYVLAAIVLLGLGLLATAVLLIARRVSMLPKFMLGAGLAVALVCNVIGPQAFVTAQNLQRVIDPSMVPADGYSGIDLDYISLLGADVVPVIVDSRSRLPAEVLGQVDQMLAYTAIELRQQAAETGWPSWNLSRQRALESLDAAGF